MNKNFIGIFDDRKTKINLFVKKINRLILLSKSKDLKEFVTKSEYTNLSYDQISKLILKNYSFNKKILQYEWDNAKEIKKRDLIEESFSNIEIQEHFNSKNVEKEKIQKNQSLSEKRSELRKEHMLMLSNKRNIKSYTIVGPLSEKFESIVFDQENMNGFENMSISDLVNLALADFVKNYT